MDGLRKKLFAGTSLAGQEHGARLCSDGTKAFGIAHPRAAADNVVHRVFCQRNTAAEGGKRAPADRVIVAEKQTVFAVQRIIYGHHGRILGVRGHGRRLR